MAPLNLQEQGMSLKVRFNSIFLAIAAATGIAVSPVQACTDIKLSAKDGTLMVTRTLEFATDLKSNINTSPRGRVFTTTTPNNKPGLTWKAKYGYVFLDGFDTGTAMDGLNEAGLSFEYLYLPGETTYQTIPEGKDSQTVPYAAFGDWIMSNFKTVDEVKAALGSIYVSSQTLPQLGEVVLPLHGVITDANGNSIVVQFYDNKINVSDGVGVATNSPKYGWHVTNLRNYVNLTPDVPPPVVVQGNMTFAAVGMGSGAVGLPGDASPPSRFVKMAFMLKNVYQPENSTDLLNVSQHIINNVDLPAGYVRTIDNGKTSTDTTQWAVFKDLTNKVYYYRTYNDMTVRSVSMDKLDFSENAPQLKMSLVGTPVIPDVTEQFLKSK